VCACGCVGGVRHGVWVVCGCGCGNECLHDCVLVLGWKCVCVCLCVCVWREGGWSTAMASLIGSAETKQACAVLHFLTCSSHL